MTDKVANAVRERLTALAMGALFSCARLRGSGADIVEKGEAGREREEKWHLCVPEENAVYSRALAEDGGNMTVGNVGSGTLERGRRMARRRWLVDDGTPRRRCDEEICIEMASLP